MVKNIVFHILFDANIENNNFENEIIEVCD